MSLKVCFQTQLVQVVEAVRQAAIQSQAVLTFWEEGVDFGYDACHVDALLVW
jgi:hypothetical protein